MKDSIKKSYKDIPGWLDYQDLYLKTIKENLKNGDIAVEVGSWMGKSAAYFIEKMLENKKDINFYCVDLWSGKQGDKKMEEIIEKNGGTIFHIFEKNMKNCGYEKIIKPIVGDSAESASLFEDKSVSFCFIDAMHTYENVKKDIECWMPKMKQGAILAGHDIDQAQVLKAVEETLGKKWEKTSTRCWCLQIN